MVCLSPRAPGDSVRPRRLSDVVVRPLNFTVRSHLGTSGFAKKMGKPASFWLCGYIGCSGLDRPAGVYVQRNRRARAALWARSALDVSGLRLPARRRTRTVVICEGDF